MNQKRLVPGSPAYKRAMEAKAKPTLLQQKAATGAGMMRGEKTGPGKTPGPAAEKKTIWGKPSVTAPKNNMQVKAGQAMGNMAVKATPPGTGKPGGAERAYGSGLKPETPEERARFEREDAEASRALKTGFNPHRGPGKA